LTTQKDLSEQCLDKSGICVIGILPTVFEEDERSASEQADAIKVMEGLKKLENDKNGRLSPFLFQWVDSELGQDIISKFDMSQDYPTLVVVKPTKHLYRPYVGAWSEIGIKAWLDLISAGRLPVWDYKGDPQIKVAASQPARDEL
jgi:protein disulfide-isomerase A6